MSTEITSDRAVLARAGRTVIRRALTVAGMHLIVAAVLIPGLRRPARSGA